MFKTMNKITALIVAVAGVVSLIPSTGVRASTRLGTKDGSIDNAIAFKDGKYIFEGYKTDDDDKAVYYNANSGSKDKQLKDLEEGTLVSAFGDKYAYVEDGREQYLVDLSNGKVIDDEGPEEKADTARTKLRTALKRTDRYGKDGLNVILDQDSEIKTANKFFETWYSYKAEVKEGEADGYYNAITDEKTGTKVLYGFTNKSGKYIDASNLANIYVYSTERNKTVKVKNFNDKNKDAQVQVNLLEQPKVIAQDKDYLYTKIKVEIIDNGEKAQINLTEAEKQAKEKVNVAQAKVDKYTNTAKEQQEALKTAKAELKSETDKTKDLEKALEDAKVAIKDNGNVTEEKQDKVTKAEEAKTEETKTDEKEQVIVAKLEDVKATVNEKSNITEDQQVAIKKAEEALKANKVAIEEKTLAVEKAQKVLDSALGIFAEELKSAQAELDTANDELIKIKEQQGSDGSITSVASKREATYIQKISKAQGDKEDDAYIPKNVYSYEVSKDYNCTDADDAEEAIDKSEHYSVKDGKLFAISLDADNVKVTVIKLKKDKVELDDSKITDRKIDVDLAEKDTDDDCDAELTDNEGKGYSIDVDGNVWVIDSGKISKFSGKEFKQVYTCDRSLDSLDVYDEGSLIAWEYGDDVYTTVQEGKKEVDDETTPDHTGWVKTDTGWTFYDGSGKQVLGSWTNADGLWYLIKPDGIMATGWQNHNGNWYFLDTTSGAMKTGWYNDNGTWYYLQPSGAMKTGWINLNGTWYFLNTTSGAMKTGWLNDNGTWYYLSPSGAMLANTIVDGYTLAANGAWVR